MLPGDHLARFILEVIERLDLSALTRAYSGHGSAVYHPDHDTLANFRRRFHDELAGIFLQVLELANEMKLLKLGTISLDGTKLHANASRHSARSYGHTQVLERQFKAEVRELLGLAESADQAAFPGGIDLPDEIKRRQDRLLAMDAAKTRIEARARARVRFEQDQAAFQGKLAKRAARTARSLAASRPEPPPEVAVENDQINLTDEGSRIMRVPRRPACERNPSWRINRATRFRPQDTPSSRKSSWLLR